MDSPVDLLAKVRGLAIEHQISSDSSSFAEPLSHTGWQEDLPTER